MRAALAAEGVSVVAELETASEIAQCPAADGFILGPDMLDMAAPDLVEALRQLSATAHVVAIIEPPGAKLAAELLRVGAVAVVFEPELERALGAALRSATAGLVSMPLRVGREATRRPLSARERQILGMVVMGSTNAEIAGRLFLAESTVKSHLSTAFRKLGVRSRNEAAALLMDPDQVGLGVLTIPRG